MTIRKLTLYWRWPLCFRFCWHCAFKHDWKVLTCFHREISLERAERVYCKLFRFPSTILKNISLTKINAITKHWKNSVASLKHIMINLYENYVRLRSSIMAIRRIPKWSVWNTLHWNIYTTLGAFQRRFLTDLEKERYLILNDHMLAKRHLAMMMKSTRRMTAVTRVRIQSAKMAPSCVWNES